MKKIYDTIAYLLCEICFKLNRVNDWIDGDNITQDMLDNHWRYKISGAFYSAGCFFLNLNSDGTS